MKLGYLDKCSKRKLVRDIQGSHGDWKRKKEKSWNMKDWPKVVEFCDQSWNFTNFAPPPPELYQICNFLSPLRN